MWPLCSRRALRPVTEYGDEPCTSPGLCPAVYLKTRGYHRICGTRRTGRFTMQIHPTRKCNSGFTWLTRCLRQRLAEGEGRPADNDLRRTHYRSSKITHATRLPCSSGRGRCQEGLMIGVFVVSPCVSSNPRSCHCLGPGKHPSSLTSTIQSCARGPT